MRGKKIASDRSRTRIGCGDSPLARQKGFEPPTFRLGGERSILLSYWRFCLIILYQKPGFVKCRQKKRCAILKLTIDKNA